MCFWNVFKFRYDNLFKLVFVINLCNWFISVWCWYVCDVVLDLFVNLILVVLRSVVLILVIKYVLIFICVVMFCYFFDVY